MIGVADPGPASTEFVPQEHGMLQEHDVRRLVAEVEQLRDALAQGVAERGELRRYANALAERVGQANRFRYFAERRAEEIADLRERLHASSKQCQDSEAGLKQARTEAEAARSQHQAALSRVAALERALEVALSEAASLRQEADVTREEARPGGEVMARRWWRTTRPRRAPPSARREGAGQAGLGEEG